MQQVLGINSKSVSYLQIFATISVVVLHSDSLWREAPAILGTTLNLGLFLKGMSFYAVPMFVLLSGYCLSASHCGISEFYRKRCRRICFPLLFWSTFYLFIRFFSKSESGKLNFIFELLRGTPYYHLWFMYMLLGLYAIAPFLLAWWRKHPISLFFSAVFFQGCVYYFYSLWETPIAELFFFRFIPFTGLFVIGFFMHHIPQGVKWKIFFGTLSIIYFSGMFIATWLQYAADWRLYSYFNVFGATGALVVMGFFLQFPDWDTPLSPLHKKIRMTASCSFGVYLIHPLLLHFASKSLRFIAGDTTFVCLLLMSLVILVSFALVYVIQYIPFLNCIFGGAVKVPKRRFISSSETS
jgi:surface polysaccharide O-acyltransferase-like enzyme